MRKDGLPSVKKSLYPDLYMLTIRKDKGLVSDIPKIMFDLLSYCYSLEKRIIDLEKKMTV